MVSQQNEDKKTKDDMKGEKFSCRGTDFLVECKEHINRVAGPGARNYIIRGLISYGEEVIFPGSIDGDPVTSFLPFNSLTEKPVYPGVRKLWLPGRLGRFIERNDVFPDLESLEVDPENRIFSTDGRMLYRDGGKELWLSLSAGIKDEIVTVPEKVERLGPAAFTDSRCNEIIYENPMIEAADTGFEGSEWLKSQGSAVYVGNMLYRVKAGERGKISVSIKKGTERIHGSAFSELKSGMFLRICMPQGMELPGLADAIMVALKKSRGFISVSREEGTGEISIPLSLDLTGMELLRKTVDLGIDLYEDIFLRIRNDKEKLDFALFVLSEEETGNEDSYRQVILKDEEAAAGRLIEILGEERICRLIKKGCIGKEALLKILPVLQDKGMVSAAAAVLIV